MATHISHSPRETEALGEAWGREAESGLVFCLSGDLGAGKTQLVKGLARGLDIPTRVHSPSFSLVNVYTGGRLTLFHLDLYRLDKLEQIIAAGLEEYLHPMGITVIEWAERWFGKVQMQKHEEPAADASNYELRTTNYELQTKSTHFRWVEIETLSENERRITYEL